MLPNFIYGDLGNAAHGSFIFFVMNFLRIIPEFQLTGIVREKNEWWDGVPFRDAEVL